jgi:hypothetical protein
VQHHSVMPAATALRLQDTTAIMDRDQHGMHVQEPTAPPAEDVSYHLEQPQVGSRCARYRLLMSCCTLPGLRMQQ